MQNNSASTTARATTGAASPIKECRHYPKCSGCNNRNQDLATQTQLKKNHLLALFNRYASQFNIDPQMIETHQFHDQGILRDRVDYTFVSGRLGLYQADRDINKEPLGNENTNSETNPHQIHNQTQKQILDLEDCQILSPGLKKNVQVFHEIVIKNENILTIWNEIFKKPVSLRFRFHPKISKPMLWLDAANIEIKSLLSNDILMTVLVENFILEIGQKFKQVKKINQQWKLIEVPSTEASFLPIFQTQYRQQQIDLLGSIGHFTQPSLTANTWITEKIQDFAKSINAETCVEFGAGIGNLSIPMAGYTKSVFACDWNQSALMALSESLKQNQITNVHIVHGDLQQEKNLQSVLKNSPTQIDVLLLNPARSGVKNFIKLSEQKNRYLVYMSCFPETLAKDLSVIQHQYTIQEAHIIEQFPWTDHYEVLIFFSRKEANPRLD